jgi:hypothetical protein
MSSIWPGSSRVWPSTVVCSDAGSAACGMVRVKEPGSVGAASAMAPLLSALALVTILQD